MPSFLVPALLACVGYRSSVARVSADVVVVRATLAVGKFADFSIVGVSADVVVLRARDIVPFGFDESARRADAAILCVEQRMWSLL